jgi:hypothetical protein
MVSFRRQSRALLTKVKDVKVTQAAGLPYRRPPVGRA